MNIIPKGTKIKNDGMCIHAKNFTKFEEPVIKKSDTVELFSFILV